jgi:Na+-driven multidrug efflux pump
MGIVLWIAGYFFFNGILNIPEERMFAARMVYYGLIVSTMFTVMTVPYDAVLNAHENMLYYAIVGIIESVLKLTVALVVVYTMSDKLIVYGALMAGISFLVMIIMRVYCHRKYEECVFKPKRYYDKTLMKEMMGFAGWNFLSAASSLSGQYGLGIVLNHFWGVVLNAAQGIANQICGQLMVFSNTLQKALNPVITKSEGAGNRFKMLQASMSGCKLSFLLLTFFAVPFLIETDYIMNLWLKNVPEWAVLFCRLQLIKSLIEQLPMVLEVSVYAQGDIGNMSKVKGVVNILPVLLSILLFSLDFPPYYMYIVGIACWSVIGGGIKIFYAITKCGLSLKRYANQVIIPSFVLFFLVFLATIIPFILMQQGIIRLLVIFVVSSVTYIVVLRYSLSSLERQVVVKMANTVKNKWL